MKKALLVVLTSFASLSALASEATQDMASRHDTSGPSVVSLLGIAVILGFIGLRMRNSTHQ